MASDNMIVAAAFVSGVTRGLEPIDDFDDVPLIVTADVLIHGAVCAGITKYLMKYVDKNATTKRTFIYCTLSASSVYFLYNSIVSNIDFDVDYDIDNAC